MLIMFLCGIAFGQETGTDTDAPSIPDFISLDDVEVYRLDNSFAGYLFDYHTDNGHPQGSGSADDGNVIDLAPSWYGEIIDGTIGWGGYSWTCGCTACDDWWLDCASTSCTLSYRYTNGVLDMASVRCDGVCSPVIEDENGSTEPDTPAPGDDPTVKKGGGEDPTPGSWSTTTGSCGGCTVVQSWSSGGSADE